MALHQSKIYRVLGGDMVLVREFCGQMDSMRSGEELKAWIYKAGARDMRSSEAAEISDQNLTDFRQGYFAKWKKEQVMLSQIRERAATAARVVREAEAGGASLTESARAQALNVITDVLSDFDAESLKATLAEDPAKFFSLVKSITDSSAVESARAALAQKAAKLEADLRTAAARIREMESGRELARAKLREQVESLGKLIKANPAGAGHAEKITVLLSTLEAL